MTLLLSSMMLMGSLGNTYAVPHNVVDASVRGLSKRYLQFELRAQSYNYIQLLIKRGTFAGLWLSIL